MPHAPAKAMPSFIDVSVLSLLSSRRGMTITEVHDAFASELWDTHRNTVTNSIQRLRVHGHVTQVSTQKQPRGRAANTYRRTASGTKLLHGIHYRIARTMHD